MSISCSEALIALADKVPVHCLQTKDSVTERILYLSGGVANGKIVNRPFPYIEGFTSVGLKELEPQLLALNPSEKVQAIQLLAQSLGSNWKGIEKTPKVCGGEARIAKTRIPIWVLVEARRLGYSDAELLTSYPTITATDLANAWTYAEAHPDEIELAIERNEVA